MSGRVILSRRSREALNGLAMEIIYGINAVVEALKARSRGFEYVGVMRERQDGRAQQLFKK